MIIQPEFEGLVRAADESCMARDLATGLPPRISRAALPWAKHGPVRPILTGSSSSVTSHHLLTRRGGGGCAHDSKRVFLRQQRST